MNNRSTVDDNIQLYRQIWDQILNKRNLNQIDTHFAPDYVFKTATVSLTGIDEAKQYYGAILRAFSDIEFVIEDAFGQGDKLVKRWVFRGTHTGELSGIPATGKRISLVGVTLARMVNGKITEERDYADDLGLLQQLGVIPQLGS